MSAAARHREMSLVVQAPPDPQLIRTTIVKRSSSKNGMLRSMSPIYHVLSTAELLDSIVASVKSTIHEDRFERPQQEHSRLRWKAAFLPLLTVNSAFFRAVVYVIWEDMDCLSPFLALLQSSGASSTLMEFPHGISAESWTRFKLYSTRTISLAVNSLEPLVSPCWAMHIASSNYRPFSLFPRLRQLNLASPHGLAQLITSTTRLSLEEFTIAFNTGYHDADAQVTTAIVASLVGGTIRLASLSLMNVVDQAVISNISTISSLRHLTLHIASSNTGLLLSLANLRLETLRLNIAPSATETERTVPLTATLFTYILSRRSLATLRSLAVVASCRRQLEVASMFGPTQLNNIKLDFVYNDNSCQNTHMAPFILAVYLARNRRLSSLSATGVSIPKHNELRRAPIDNGAQDWTLIFLSRLSEVRSLERINVENVLFPASDVVVNALQVLPSLPMLQSFRFTPCIPPSTAAVWARPSMEVLRSLINSNPMLTTLAIPFDCSSLLHSLPTDFVSSHQMQFLTLITPPAFRVSSLSFSSQIQLSLNLHTLFPVLRSLTGNFQHYSAQWSDWQPIEMLMATHRQVYARAMQSAQQQVDIASYIQNS